MGAGLRFLLLAACLAALLGLGFITTGHGRAVGPAQGDGAVDYELYRTIVERVRNGENYYTAASAELRRPRGPAQLGYPTRSVFNWRLPTLAWLLAQVPSIEFARGVYLFLSGLALVCVITARQAEPLVWRRAAVGALLGTGLLWGWPGWPIEALLVHETWAGMLLALSISAQARNWTRLAISSGLAALFIRELALPYVLVSAYLTLRNKKRAETMAWLIGLAGFAAVLLWHARIVQMLILPEDRAQDQHWIQFGGWAFVLKTAHLHPLLLGGLFERPWIVAVLLPLALMGFTAWTNAWGQHVRLTVAAYVLAYACVGQPFNYLWGLMYTPLWPLGLLFVVDVARPFILRKETPPRPQPQG